MRVGGTASGGSGEPAGGAEAPGSVIVFKCWSSDAVILFVCAGGSFGDPIFSEGAVCPAPPGMDALAVAEVPARDGGGLSAAAIVVIAGSALMVGVCITWWYSTQLIKVSLK